MCRPPLVEVRTIEFYCTITHKHNIYHSNRSVMRRTQTSNDANEPRFTNTCIRLQHISVPSYPSSNIFWSTDEITTKTTSLAVNIKVVPDYSTTEYIPSLHQYNLVVRGMTGNFELYQTCLIKA
ncbi:hypothetical protein AVEN_73346-1 [Araneus ventricosus]|uniref:Uncharacterized protein n=1 Tax=Araneus ventricosus TaxID=182803 RepID=A0A4Y2NMC1_ARAVE|nr:hypothetical protein AVEN_73346-1 [Araneus ventricosus]